MSSFLQAARFTDKNSPEPHQVAAWSMAWSWLTKEQQDEFLQAFRDKAEPESVIPLENSWEGVLAEAKRTGVKYPELVAAQWALESGWGKKTSGKNNYFGLKGKGSNTTKVVTTEYINGVETEVEDYFLNFASLSDCVKYLTQRWYYDFTMGGKLYHGVNRAPNRTQAAKGLVEEGYATDPKYAEKLIEIMNRMDPKPPVVSQPKPPVNLPPENGSKVLSVPWYSQMDSATDQGRRMCFSSSCAMLVACMKPGRLVGANGDDQYLATVRKYGDTTDPAAQLRALEFYGIDATFTKNANWDDIESQINLGIPVPCGYLHRGPVHAPQGGGHWLTVVGYDPLNAIVHDPLSESDLINGTTASSVARYAKYSRKNWGRRWMVEGPDTGWAIIAKR